MNKLRVSNNAKRQTLRIINPPVNIYIQFSVEKNTNLSNTNQTYAAAKRPFQAYKKFAKQGRAFFPWKPIKYKADIVILFSSQIPNKLGFRKVQTGLSMVKINTNSNLGFLNMLFIYS